MHKCYQTVAKRTGGNDKMGKRIVREKKIAVLLFAVIAMCCRIITVHAATNMQDGIKVELVTDKVKYSSEEQINATLTVTNTNNAAVTNVLLECFVPEGYKLADGLEAVKQIDILNAGETVKVTHTYIRIASVSGTNTGDSGKSDADEATIKKSGTGSKTTANPKTGDDSNLVLWAVIMLVSAGGAVVFVVLKNRKRGKPILSLFLCLAMMEGIVAGVLPMRASAADNLTAEQSIDISAVVSVNDSNVTFSARVSYAHVPNHDTPVNYTRGEWIEMLAEKVGMNYSANSEQLDFYFADTKSSSYGVAIEAAQAYGILPSPDIEDLEQDIPFFYPDDIATREFAAYTAVHAMGFDGSHLYNTTTWTDWNLIDYQNEAAVAVGNGFLNLDENMMFHPASPLSGKDVESIFKTIDDIKKADADIGSTAYDETKYASAVVKDEVSSISEYTVAENGDGTYSVMLSKSNAAKAIEVGSVVVLPANSTYLTGISLKVLAISDNGNQLALTCVEPDLNEVYTKIDFAGGGTALVGSVAPAENVEVKYNPGSSLVDEINLNTMEGSNSITVTKDARLGGSTRVPGTFTFDVTDKKITDNLTVSGSVEVEIPRITCVADIDVGWSGLDVNEFTFAVTEKAKLKGELVSTSESGYELTNSLNHTRFEKGRIELGRVPVALSVTGLSVDLVFYYNFEAKGSANITYTIESTQGAQYKNGSFRKIFDYDDELDFTELKGSAKVGLGIAGDLNAFSLMDLAGYFGEAGVAFNASFTPRLRASESDTLYCSDVTVYAYAKHGLDPETAVGKFLKNICHYTLEFDVLKNNSNNPFKSKFHVENGSLVEECSFGMGGITGYVYSLDGRTPLENARVNIYSPGSEGNDLLRTLYTDAGGRYSVENLTEGTYRVVVSATGYFTYEVTIRVEHNQMTYIENLLMVDRSGSGVSSLVEGTITDAVTGNGVTNTAYILREGWNNRAGEGIASGNFENSSYSMSLGVGNYTLEIAKEGYVTNYTNIAVSADSCNGADIVLSPSGADVTGEDLRIVLTWGEYPYDLDSHLVCTSEDSYHTYYMRMRYGEIANLDIDDTNSYGPETTTVNQIRAGDKFSFYVHDFSNLGSNDSDKMSLSDAKVQVYSGGNNIANYVIPSNRGGTLWHVFDYDSSTGVITPVNEFSYHSNPSTVGGDNNVNVYALTYEASMEKTHKSEKESMTEEKSEDQKVEENVTPSNATPDKSAKIDITSEGEDTAVQGQSGEADAVETEEFMSEVTDTAYNPECGDANMSKSSRFGRLREDVVIQKAEDAPQNLPVAQESDIVSVDHNSFPITQAASNLAGSADAAKTGDDSAVVLYALLLLAGIAGASTAGIVRIHKRRKISSGR